MLMNVKIFNQFRDQVNWKKV